MEEKELAAYYDDLKTTAPRGGRGGLGLVFRLNLPKDIKNGNVPVNNGLPDNALYRRFVPAGASSYKNLAADLENSKKEEEKESSDSEDKKKKKHHHKKDKKEKKEKKEKKHKHNHEHKHKHEHDHKKKKGDKKKKDKKEDK